MMFSKVTATVAATLLSLAAAAPAPAAPNLTYIFTLTVNVGKVLLPPISIPGGARVVEPLTNGTIVGPALNGTVAGGVAYPEQYNGGALQVPQILVYGTAEGGANFLATIEGVGKPQLQLARANIEIGGPYAQLNQSLILVEILPNLDRTVVTVQAFCAS